MDILAQSALFLSLVSFTFGVTVLSRNYLSRVFQIYTIACLSISLWALFFFLSYFWSSNRLYDMHLAMNAWVTPPVLLFLQYWTKTERWKGSRILFYLSLSLSALLNLLLMPGLARESLTKQIAYFTPSLILIQILWFMIHDRKMRNLSELPRRSLLYSGTLLILVTCLMDHIPGLWLGISVFGNLALMSFLFYVRHNLLKQKFLHFDVFLTQFFVLIFISALLTAIYSIAAVWVKGNFKLFILNAFVLSFFLVNITPSLSSLMTHFIESFLADRVKALRLAVSETYSQVLQAIDFDGVYLQVMTFMEREFRVRDSVVLLYDPTKLLWVSLDHKFSFTEFHPVLEAFRALGKKTPSSFPLAEFIEERKRAHVQVNAEVLEFKENVGTFLVPLITSEKKWIGILGLRMREKSDGMDECLPIFRRMADLLAQKQAFDLYQDRERLATLGEVAAGLAHEIRNPLGAIKGAVQVLEDQMNAESEPLFRVIVEETNRLNGFLTQFLEYSKPVPIEPEWFSLRQMVEYVFDLTKLSHPGVNVESHWDENSSGEYQIYFGKRHFTQVLLNLFQNSFHSIEKSKKDLKQIHIQLVESDSNLLLRMRDSGEGVPEEHLKKIFIPFFTTDPAGTGLGLSISKKLMTSYSGNILVRSHWKEWTEVELQFAAFRGESPSTFNPSGVG